MKVFPLVWLALAVTSGAWAGTVNGKWTAEVQGRRGGSMTITLDLHEDDGTITGTIRTPRGENSISDAAIDGDEISFSVVTEIGGYQLTQRYRGTIEDDLIHFSLSVENGPAKVIPVRDFEAKRIP